MGALLRQLYKIVGSFDFLGDPVGVLSQASVYVHFAKSHSLLHAAPSSIASAKASQSRKTLSLAPTFKHQSSELCNLREELTLCPVFLSRSWVLE